MFTVRLSPARAWAVWRRWTPNAGWQVTDLFAAQFAALTPFEGRVWRMILRGEDAAAPVASPEGRFHHSGQSAIYTSLTAEGTVVAMRRYLAPGGPTGEIRLLLVRLSQVADARGNPDASIVWQDIRATGAASPTWAFSDAARAMGAEAMLYSSRSRPDLTHLVLFAGAPLILSVGAAEPLPG